MASYKHEMRKMPVLDAIEDFYSALETLGEECREAVENLPESLQQTERASALGSSADTIDDIVNERQEFPDSVPDALAEGLKILTVEFHTQVYGGKYRGQESRATRCANAISGAEAAISLIESWRGDKAPDDAEEQPEWVADLEAWIEEIQNHVDAAQGCEFPGQRG